MEVLLVIVSVFQASPATDPEAEWAAQLERREQEDTEAQAAFATVQSYAEIGCNDLLYCLNLFDQFDHPSVREARLEFFGARFRQHAEHARSLLLDRLVSDNRRHRNDARDILLDWGSWNSEHVARLRELVAELGTQESYEVFGSVASSDVVESLFNRIETEEQNWGALAGLRQATKRNPDEIRRYLATYIRENRDRLVWRTANLFRYANLEEDQIHIYARAGTNDALPMAEREASLRILMAIGESARPAESILVDFRPRAEPGLKRIADNILINIGNGAFVAEIAERCVPYQAEFDPYYSLSDNCPHRYLSDLGEAGTLAGPAIANLLNSPHPDQRIDALRTLAKLRYRAAIPRIMTFLSSANWREVRWSVAAIESMHASDAIPALQGVAASHWLPDVRNEAARAAADIENPALPAGDSEAGWMRDWDALNPLNCHSGQWAWQGRPITDAQYQWEDTQGPNGEISVHTPSGQFTGTNRGEWGGELTWYSGTEHETELIPENVLALHPYGDGAIVAVGLAHGFSNRGEILRVEIQPTGGPVIHRVAELPEAPYGGISHVDGRIYAAFGSGYGDEPNRHFVTVFDAEVGILGLAECVDD